MKFRFAAAFLLLLAVAFFGFSQSRPGTPQYEYDIVRLTPEGASLKVQLQSSLGAASANGWELVQTLQYEDSYYFIYKRPKR